MGNHHSSSSGGASRSAGSSSSSGAGSGGVHHLPSFRRTTGSLGLSKSELERRCKPSGLYPSCKWEERAIRRQIGDGKLAARLGGSDARTNPTDQECPICFLHYSEINITSCCNATVCTECYLQIRPQKEKVVSCPFCNNPKITIVVAKKMDSQEVEKRDHEEQTVIEAKIRARANSATGTVDSTSTDGNNNTSSAAASSPVSGGFGSSLERHSSSILRTRSESMSSADSTSEYSSAALALTPEERRRLEEEMRAQLSHPLSRRMEAEAAERRYENEREYYRSNSHRLRSRRAAEAMLMRAHGASRRDRFSRLASDTRLLSRTTSGGGRDWNSIVDAFEGGGNGEVQSLDDLVVIEAAILLSMEEEAARRRTAQRPQRRGSGDDNDDDDDEDEEDNDDFDATEQARAGFPMLRSRLARARAEADGDDGENDGALTARLRQRLRVGDDEEEDGIRSLGGRGHLLTSLQRPSSTHMDTAGMLMRGISEEEQIAMALALSLREAEAAQMRENRESDDNNDDSGNEGNTNSNREENGGDNTANEERNTETGVDGDSAVSNANASASGNEAPTGNDDS